ncbi:beta-galactosidase [Streptomyces chiangmaiensis]|uniref:Beta-galactosidase n=1 Tax=Streptomyces chiangmaiensis TaxID=766497 RepID=A0ABU7FRY9_9ACTN|nr:beta-galactosidase [Streptomyces chiangmaiensis]MED7826233.1 beta-galactosidase [Streptomyces chiangmaiensis]
MSTREAQEKTNVPSRRTVLGGLGAATAAAVTTSGSLGAAPAAAAPAAAVSGETDRVTYRDKQILVDGKPALVLSGEIHYFRLKREDWQSRLDKAKDTGLNAIATYIPWMWHETPDGTIDVTGRTRPERDLGAFLDLCIANGFDIVARPGPFTMAELKGEGVPERVRKEHPEINPTGWNGADGPTPVVDYLAPAFLKEARRWYDAVMPVLAKRLRRKGRQGVVACQLDNEIGMLDWVSNTPALTDHLLRDFNSWLDKTYDDGLGDRYAFAGKPAAERDKAIRSPEDGYSAALMHDLGAFMRGRFARYVTALREAAEDNGVRGVPFLINIHGTGGGSAANFPIGISQLMETYSGKPGMISGADFYLGDLSFRNVTDLYLVNAFMDAVHDGDQPVTALEFDAGHADYGNTLNNQSGAEAADLKTRLCLAQGAKMINYYLFAGGFNPKLDEPAGDGNDRIGSTGERHGFAAPVDPEGRPGPSYPALKRTVHAVRGNADLLAPMKTQYDGLSLGFVPDHYLTEYHPDTDSVRAVLNDVQPVRGFGPGGALARAMLLSGFRYDSVNLQAGGLDPARTPVLALATGEYLDGAIQRRLVRYVEAGGKLLLSGLLPGKDLAGRPATELRDALGLKPGKTLNDANRFFLSVTAHGWAAPRAEIRVGKAQLCTASRGDVVLREVSTGEGCGFDIRVGKGRAVVITNNYRADLDFWTAALRELGAVPGITHDARLPGVFFLTTTDPDGGRLLHAFNIASGYAQDVTVAERGKPLFGGERLHLPGRGAAMLPLGLTAGGMRIAYATAEISAVEEGRVTFRSLGDEAVVAVDGRARCSGAKVSFEGGRTLLRVRRAEFTVRRG